MDIGRDVRLAEEPVRKFAAAVRTAQLYAPDHPLVDRAMNALASSIEQLLAERPSLVIGLIRDEIIVGDTPLAKAAENYGELIRRLQSVGIERIAFERGVTPQALNTLVMTIARPKRRAGEAPAGATWADSLAMLQNLPHLSVGRITLDERIATSAADIGTVRRLYGDAVTLAGSLWDGAQRDGEPDPLQTRQLVDNLAEAVVQNRTALIALTASKDYDNYTFTHMVNVSILTMAQARALGIEGSLLRQIGVAALMHDIGKVRTPVEILNKPEKLTDDEFAVMRLHVVDGAEILRRTPEMPALAAIVAFEHHLRADGSGYPFGVTRTAMNLGTMLCSIADVYDAMRSQRAYQESFPTDRILAVLERNDGVQFDQHLVRRFAQLLGIYPPGNLVRLDTGEYGVVIQIYAPDPYRPKVRVVAGSDGTKWLRPFDVNLWEADETSPGPKSVLKPVDPSTIGIDPLNYL